MSVVRCAKPHHFGKGEELLAGLIGMQDESRMNTSLSSCRCRSFTTKVQFIRSIIGVRHVRDKEPSLIESMDHGISDCVVYRSLPRFSVSHTAFRYLKNDEISPKLSEEHSPSLIQYARKFSMRLNRGVCDRTSKSEQSQIRRSASTRGSGRVSWKPSARMYWK